MRHIGWVFQGELRASEKNSKRKMATKAATTMDEINTAVDGRLSRLLYLHVQEITRIMFEP